MSKFLEIKRDRENKKLCVTCGKERAPGCYRCNECGIKHRIKERERIGCLSHKIVGNNHLIKYQGE